jgi:hypothetical protein
MPQKKKKKKKEKFSSSVIAAPLYTSYMWLVAAILDSRDAGISINVISFF